MVATSVVFLHLNNVSLYKVIQFHATVTVYVYAWGYLQ